MERPAWLQGLGRIRGEFWPRGKRLHAVAAGAAGVLLAALAGVVRLESDDPEGPADPDGAPAEAAEPDAPSLSGRLIGYTGRPVIGAQLTWTPLLRSVLDPREDPRIEVKALARVTQRARSDAEGQFRFDSAPEPSDLGTVVWITSPEHEATALLLDPQSSDWPDGELFTLADAPRRRGRALDLAAQPVANAVVVQRAVEPAPPGLASLPLEVRAARLLVRTYISDVEGRFAPAPLAGREHCTARLGDGERSAMPIRGSGRGDLDLVLLPTFVAGGSLDYTSPSLAGVQAQIVFGRAQGDGFEELGRAAIEDGRWGPARLPRTPRDAYLFRLDGPGLVRTEVRTRAPALGAELELSHTVRAGFDLWFQVTDFEQGTLLPGAEVVLSWDEDGSGVTARGTPRNDGYLLVRGCPPGRVAGSARCPGFEAAAVAPIEVPQSPAAVIAVRLQRAD